MTTASSELGERSAPWAQEVASNASFQAFANCYLREVDAGAWQSAASWQARSGVALGERESHVVELDLASLGVTLAIGVRFWSRVGRHLLTGVHRRTESRRAWHLVDHLSAQLLLIEHLYARRPQSERRLELLARVIESHQVMADHLRQRAAKSGAAATRGLTSFIESEQSLVLGHWLHPTPKSRVGMHGWQHAHYSPELRGRFQLHFFAAARALVQQGSELGTSAEEITRHIACHGESAESHRRLAARLGDDHCLIPLHPLQAQWLLHQDYVRDLLAKGQLLDLGGLGPEFTATSSVRTLYCEKLDFMVKPSMPVKITNSLRINLRHELGDSVLVTRLLRRCALAEQFPQLRIIEDPAYITLSLPGLQETGFEVIFRSNPFSESCDGDTHASVHCVATMVQERLRDDERSRLAELIHALAERERLPLTEAALRWFDAYWGCAVEPVIRIYDAYGIALEAHQQNALLELDPSGYPRQCYYRDIQGLALAQGRRRELESRVPELAHQPKIFEPDDVVCNGLGYYLMFNQLYAVINRMALDALVSEEALLTAVHRKMTLLRPELRAQGADFVDALLGRRTIACKANLLTRVEDMDELQDEHELAVYTMVDNPLHGVRRDPSREHGPPWVSCPGA